MRCERVFSLPPVVGERPRCLILGSMPGEASLAAREYYAYPRNRFWDILGELVGAGRDLPYVERLEVLRAKRIALWDVAHSCLRVKSGDASIRSAEANDFERLFREHPTIEGVFFNGGKAEELFRRLVLPGLGARAAGFALQRLPSTSPAHAGISFAEKLRQWQAIRNCAGRG